MLQARVSCPKSSLIFCLLLFAAVNPLDRESK